MIASFRTTFGCVLKALLTNPILSLSELLRSFLDPQSIEFSSSIFNDIGQLGKMVKGVPLKLRFEVSSFELTIGKTKYF